MEREEARFWLALRAVIGGRSSVYKRLIEKWGTPEGVFEASPSDLRGVEGMTEGVVSSLKRFSRWREVDREWEALQRMGGVLIPFTSPAYPRNLLTIYDPPPLLSVRGTLLEGDRVAVAIVGSRRATPYGHALAEKVSSELVACGVTIVSGCARGIDSSAHKGAINSGGRTIAVLGCGVDLVYPRENKTLMQKIMKSGALISELPLGTPPYSRNFPPRNRIISGLSLGVLVVEAASRSGSLITARCALEQGRGVFAIPGRIGSPVSQGTHHLIKNGATLVESAEDILEELGPQIGLSPHTDKRKDSPPPPLSVEEEILFGLLSCDPRHIDELTCHSRLSPSQVSTLLVTMELKGVIRRLAGDRYVRTTL